MIENGFVCEFQGNEMVINTTGFTKLDLLRMTHGILAFVEQTGMTEDFKKYMESLGQKAQEVSEESEDL